MMHVVCLYEDYISMQDSNYVHDIRDMRITTHVVNYVCSVRDANFGQEVHDDHEVSNV
jgi:hypothetical protein